MDVPERVEVLLKVFERRYNKDDAQGDATLEPTDVSAKTANMDVTNVDNQMSLQASSCEQSSEELETRLQEAMAATTSQTAKEGLLAILRYGCRVPSQPGNLGVGGGGETDKNVLIFPFRGKIREFLIS